MGCCSVPHRRVETPLWWEGFPWMDAAAQTFPKGWVAFRAGLAPSAPGMGILAYLSRHCWDGAVPAAVRLWDRFKAPIKVSLLPVRSVLCLFHCRVGDRDGKTCRKGWIMSP